MVTILRNRGMALSFSKPLKEGIIKDWLRGKNRDTIAHENGLSTGTVSNIVKEWKEEIGSLSPDQLREFAVTLRNDGISPSRLLDYFRFYAGSSDSSPVSVLSAASSRRLSDGPVVCGLEPAFPIFFWSFCADSRFSSLLNCIIIILITIVNSDYTFYYQMSYLQPHHLI